MTYVPVHVHSEFSHLDGLSTVKEIADRCEEVGCPCCALSDHGVVSGHLDFGKELEKRGIKPIYACELYHGVKTKFAKQERDQAHFLAGALTDEGLRNLWRLVDAAADNFRFVGRVNWEMLEKHRDGMFATSACIQGLVPQGITRGDFDPLNRYLSIYKDNFYLELHTYPGRDQERINEALVQVAEERGLPLTVATDAHFASPSLYALHDLYVAMQTGQSVDTPLEERKMWHPMALYIMDEYDIRQHLAYLPERVVDGALANTIELGERANARLPEVKRHLPVFIPAESPYVKEEKTAAGLFIDLVEKGLYERYREPHLEVWERAHKEMDALLSEGLEHYFLQAWDLVQFCKERGIAKGPGRGSSAGCIVAYALGITDVDPLKYELIFERFWNPGRAKGFPDIDTDFPKDKRQQVKDYLAKRWGQDKVRAIGTQMRMKPKSAVDKAYKACGLTWDEKEAIKQIVGKVPDIDILGPDSVGWDRETDDGDRTIYVLDHVGDDLVKWIENQPDERQPVILKALDFIGQICNRVGAYGVHASGVVVSDTELDAELPSFWSAQQKTKATQFPMKAVDKRGFVKQDVLGLRTIDTLEEWASLVGGVEWQGLEDQRHPEEMWKLLEEGYTLGVFQIEGGYARKLCEQIKPRSIEDLALIVALNRPGPIRAKVPDRYMVRRNGLEEVLYRDPILEDILKPTYGLFVYQEQVIRFFEALGYSKSEADAVRKILGKKDPEEMNRLLYGAGDWENRGYLDIAAKKLANEPLALELWDEVESFALYSFNKSHAVAYAILAFRTLYAKWRAPAEFTISCIRTNPDDAGDYVREGNRIGVKVRPPDIEKSEVDIAVIDGEIYFGFSNVKGIGVGTGKYLVGLRDKRKIHSRELLQQALRAEMEEWELRKAEGFVEKSPKQRFRSNCIDVLERAGAFDRFSERSLTMREIQANERELLGVILTDTCAEAFDNNSELLDECGDYEELEFGDHKMTTLPGIVTKVRETRVKSSGKPMGIVTVEWKTKSVEFAVFPQQWKSYKFMWSERTPVIVTLEKTPRGIHFEDGLTLG